MKIKLLVCIVFIIMAVGCEYKPHKIHKIKTINGDIVYLSCPELDPYFMNNPDWDPCGMDH